MTKCRVARADVRALATEPASLYKRVLDEVPSVMRIIEATLAALSKSLGGPFRNPLAEEGGFLRGGKLLLQPN